MTRVEQVYVRRAERASISIEVAKPDNGFLREIAADEDVTLNGLFRLAMDQFLSARGLPRLEPLRRRAVAPRKVRS